MQKQIDLDLAIKLHSSLNIAVDSSVAFSVQLNSERQSFLRPTRPHSFPKKSSERYLCNIITKMVGEFVL
jgi:hypothetical protein